LADLAGAFSLSEGPPRRYQVENGSLLKSRSSCRTPAPPTTAYDGLNNLTQLTACGPAAGQPWALAASSKPRASSTAAQSRRSAAGTLTYTFDANGNELTNSGGLSYTYNAQNQTSNVSSTQPPNSLGMTYTGPDQSERLTAGNRSFTYSAMGMYSQTASGTFNSSVNMPASEVGTSPAAAQPATLSPVQAALTHNQPGTASAMVSSPSGTYYFTHDPQGALTSESTPSGKYYYSFSAIQLGLGPNPGALSIAATTDSTGAIADSYINCPSGNNISQSGTAPNSWHTQSSYYDSTTGTQLYLGNGIFDSTIARWGQSAVNDLAAGLNGRIYNSVAFAIPDPLVPASGYRNYNGTAPIPFTSIDASVGYYVTSTGDLYPYVGLATRSPGLPVGVGTSTGSGTPATGVTGSLNINVFGHSISVGQTCDGLGCQQGVPETGVGTSPGITGSVTVAWQSPLSLNPILGG